MQRDLNACAPKFADAVREMLTSLEGGRKEYPFETLRTEARQAFLYGFGREYDDGRGKVTGAETALLSWHGFGLAVDIVEKDNTPWDAPAGFWESIGISAEARGLVWGGRWKKPDRPHVQWGRCPVTPTEVDRQLFRQIGIEAVWVKYGAV